jgi:hypothetical protein
MVILAKSLSVEREHVGTWTSMVGDAIGKVELSRSAQLAVFEMQLAVNCDEMLQVMVS